MFWARIALFANIYKGGGSEVRSQMSSLAYLSPKCRDMTEVILNTCIYIFTVLFEDSYTATKILQASDPRNMKQLGRLVKGFQEHVWESYASDIVLKGNIEKVCIITNQLTHVTSAKATLLNSALSHRCHKNKQTNKQKKNRRNDKIITKKKIN